MNSRATITSKLKSVSSFRSEDSIPVVISFKNETTGTSIDFTLSASHVAEFPGYIGGCLNRLLREILDNGGLKAKHRFTFLSSSGRTR